MANIPGTNVASTIAPFTTDDQFPTHDAKYGKGGQREVATIAERDAIPLARLTEGCTCYVAATEKTYRWKSNAWVDDTPEITSDASDIDYTPSGSSTQTTVAGALDSLNESVSGLEDSVQGNADNIADLQEGAVAVDVDTNTKVFTIKNAKGQDVGTITVNETTGLPATLTLAKAGTNGQSITISLPTLAYNSQTQMLEYVDATGTHVPTIKLSNLQIKEVAASTSALQLTPTLGDLVLIGDNTNGYELNVYDGTNWQSLGSINNVSLVAEQVGLSSTKLSSTDVKSGLEELSDKVDAVGASYWTGSIGISSATIYSNVSGLTEYNKQSEPIDVYVTTAGYLWIVSSVKIIAETSGIEIPMLAPVKSGDLYYYRSEEVVKESISVMVKALAKQEGTDPNDSVTIIGSIGSDSSYTVGDTATTLSVNANSNNGGSLSYQWEKNGFAITDANSSTYTPSTSSASDSGTYRCKVTNLLDNGYEYTNVVVIEVKESQGEDTTSDWLEDTGVVNGVISQLQGRSLSPAYQIDNGDVIYAWVGFNNDDSTIKVISGWQTAGDDSWVVGWNQIKYNGRLVNTSDNANCNYIRVTVNSSVINKCFIYNCTKETWLYKGSEIGNTYNDFKWCTYIKTGSTYNGQELQADNSSSAYAQTHMSPLIPISTDNEYEIKTNMIYAGSGFAKIIFCDSEGEPNLNSSYARYLAITSNDPRTMTFTNKTDVLQYARIFISAKDMHDCYIKDITNDVYLWKGIDVND